MDGVLKTRFMEVFKLNHWRDPESASGPGSRQDSPSVKAALEALRLIAQEYHISSISDIPCGDFNWIHEFLREFPKIGYRGFDIVEPLIERNQQLFPQFDFSPLDIASDIPPKADLIFCKDLLNHLTYSDIQQAIENMKASRSTYLLTTNNFGYQNVELPVNAGPASRHLDLTAAPFNYPAPIWHTNYLSLWKLADLTHLTPAPQWRPDNRAVVNLDLGSLELLDGRDYFVTSTNKGGCAVFGPWTSLAAGRYVVTFDVSIGDYPAYYQDMVCGILEVTANCASDIIARSWLFASRLRCGQRITKLEFEIGDAQAVEFRVHTTGRAPLKISLDRPVVRLPSDERTYSPVLSDGSITPDRFFIDHYGQFRNLFEAGASIRATDTGTIAEISGVSFYIENVEDFQIVHEIFVKGEYNFISERKSLVVDVGMNVGLLSLHMANQPNVVEVHAYEPFSGPFLRASKNFALNTEIAKKIRPCFFGLGDKDEFFEVAVSDEKTIGTSIKGRDNGTNDQGGRLEKVEVRDAKSILSPIFAEAESRGLDIVLKLDCEGSEFPILASLDAAGILGKVRVLFIEWHKSWSPGLTQKDIIDRLVPKGFVVLDRTESRDVWAGQLYAIRRD